MAASPSVASTPPVLARSQCEGSIIQGIGLALYEQQVLDPHTGLTLTANLEDYRIPQLGDTPEIDIHFHEDGLGPRARRRGRPRRGRDDQPGGIRRQRDLQRDGLAAPHPAVRPDRMLEGLRTEAGR